MTQIKIYVYLSCIQKAKCLIYPAVRIRSRRNAYRFHMKQTFRVKKVRNSRRFHLLHYPINGITAL